YTLTERVLVTRRRQPTGNSGRGTSAPFALASSLSARRSCVGRFSCRLASDSVQKACRLEFTFTSARASPPCQRWLSQLSTGVVPEPRPDPQPSRRRCPNQLRAFPKCLEDMTGPPANMAPKLQPLLR